MQQLLELLELFGALEKIHLLWVITFHIYYSKKGNVVHFRLILFIFLLAQSLHAKPIIYFILSNDCPICHNLMNDIKSNNNLKALLTNEYQVKILSSNSLLDQLSLDNNYIRLPLGDIELRGKGQRVALSTIQRYQQ